jgi:hypothetical protein
MDTMDNFTLFQLSNNYKYNINKLPKDIIILILNKIIPSSLQFYLRGEAFDDFGINNSSFKLVNSKILKQGYYLEIWEDVLVEIFCDVRNNLYFRRDTYHSNLHGKYSNYFSYLAFYNSKNDFDKITKSIIQEGWDPYDTQEKYDKSNIYQIYYCISDCYDEYMKYLNDYIIGKLTMLIIKEIQQ